MEPNMEKWQSAIVLETRAGAAAAVQPGDSENSLSQHHPRLKIPKSQNPVLGRLTPGKEAAAAI